MARAAWLLYRYLGLSAAGLIFYLEGIGLPIPVEIPLSISGARMVQGLNTYWQMAMLMFLSNVAGNLTGYFLGYYGGRPLALRVTSWFRISPESWDKLEVWFRRHGLKVVVATRWINWGFAQNIWLCGITRVPFGRFFLIVFVNDFFWAMAWTWLTEKAAHAFRRWEFFEFLHNNALALGLGAVAVALLAGAFWWFFRRKRSK